MTKPTLLVLAAGMGSRRMGAAALEMDTSDGSSQTRWRDIVAARLPSQHWPQQPVLIAADDAHSGEPVVFDRHSGIGRSMSTVIVVG